MTVTPTAAKDSAPMARSAVETKSRSTFPSMMTGSYLPSSAADRLNTASGKRAWRCEVIVGLMSRTRGKALMRRPLGRHAAGRRSISQ